MSESAPTASEDTVPNDVIENSDTTDESNVSSNGNSGDAKDDKQ